MARVFTILMAMVSFAITLSFNSCTKTCDEGYEGSRCDIPWNQKFIGTYAVTDSGKQVTNYSLTIKGSTTNIAGGITLKNFGGLDTNSIIIGSVNGIALSILNTPIGTVQIVNASGSISNNALSYLYTSINSTDTVQHIAVGTK